MPVIPIGIYIHIPFCDGKCPYCDFYSVSPDEQQMLDYCSALEREMAAFAGLRADTVYFGGGTPTLMGSKLLVRLLQSVKSTFDIDEDSEITFEMNPRTADLEMLRTLKTGGFNRVSIGLQSGLDSELAALGRRHSLADAQSAVYDVRAAGFDNLSLDLMLGIPGQTSESLARSIEAVCALEPEHVSAYILKIEPDTPFASMSSELELADEDGQAELYTQAVNALEQRGYLRYEISNFARNGMVSRHNTRYWDCGEYLGFGPAAHSFFGGRRFYYPRDLSGFISGTSVIDDGDGGDRNEYLMLRMRLTEGVTRHGWRERFGESIPPRYYDRAMPLAAGGLLTADEDGIRLCGDGFLLSNAVIARLMDD